MLERVIVRLKEEGFDDIVVNIHHFGDQIIDFLESKNFGVRIGISDERGNLLDTGGGLVYADSLLGDEPALVHNVDILSNADLQGLMLTHKESQAGGSLLISNRESSRKLIFDSEMKLKGWHHLGTGEYKPTSYTFKEGEKEYAFSGIYVNNGEMRREMRRLFGERAFPVMDYFLSKDRRERVDGVIAPNLNLIDIGKPATLKAAQLWW